MNIEMKNGMFRYGTGKTVFKNLNFNVNNGEILSILGPNGTGKTTLLKCLLGMHQISDGSVIINGLEQDKAKKNYHIGYVPQLHQSAFQYTVLEMVLMGRTRFIRRFSSPSHDDWNYAHKSLEKVGMEGFADRIFSDLSGGEKQMVLIARALASQADCIIFDEPTSALDYRNQYHVLDLMISLKREENLAIIMTTHQPEHAMYLSDKALLMDRDGNSCFGESDDVLSENNLNATYGMNIGIFSIPHKNAHLKAIIPLVSNSLHRSLSGNNHGNEVAS
ncbi:MAG: ABC transporter ATP-binding protein [Methanospirillum sp.]|nr:ABC transporter ATP-binding protein [Methanospirillum sp.]